MILQNSFDMSILTYCLRGQSQTMVLASNDTVLYTWDDPTAERMLMWNVYGRSKPNYPTDISKVRDPLGSGGQSS